MWRQIAAATDIDAPKMAADCRRDGYRYTKDGCRLPPLRKPLLFLIGGLWGREKNVKRWNG